MLGFLRTLSALLLIAGLLAGTERAAAYVRTMASTGTPLFWASPAVSLQGNPANSSGLSEADVSSLFTSSFTSWNLPGTRVAVSYLQSAGFPANSATNAINSVYFTSRGGRSLPFGVIAVTEVLYFVVSGQIIEADMVFNDNQFLFTGNEGDTGRTIGGRVAIYLPDVATHESGHVLGLDHSQVNNSSLIYTAFSGQFTVSKDDAAAVRTFYTNGAGGNGSLVGTVSGTRGGIFGAHVTAVNLSSGKVEAGALSSSDGSFRLGDIPAGKYAVMMEPFATDISSVSPYFKNVNHRFCGSSKFRRRFYSACDSLGSASVVEVTAGGQTALGTLAPSCTSMGNPAGPPTSIPGAQELSNAGGAAFGTLRPGDTHYYVVRNVSGALSAKALSYSLYSPVDAHVQFLNSDGSALAGATSVDNVGNPMPGGKTNFDSSAAANVALGTYIVKISSAASRVPATQYSAGYDLLDADGHYLLAFGVNGDFGPATVSDMANCLSVRNTSQSASFLAVSERGDDEDARTAGCGSLSSAGGNPFSGGMMQVLLVASALHALVLARRWRLRPGLVRRRR